MKQFNFSRLFLVLWMLLCNVFVFADDLITEQVVVNVEEPGTLPDKISDADKDRITDLKIIGELNGTDVRLIREMAGADSEGQATTGHLQKLDLTDVSFGTGGMGRGFLSGCAKIESVKLGEKITSISMNAFSGCSHLSEIEMPSSIVSIGMEAFWFCSSLKKIVIPEKVTLIDGSTFGYCKNLKDVTLPKGLKYIYNQAFTNCSSLDSLNIPESLEFLDYWAFNDLKKVYITSLESWMKIRYGDGACWPKIHLFLNGEEIERLVIPNTVKVIRNGVFSNCAYIKSVSIPESVININSGAFSGCASLTKVILPNKLENIGSKVFAGCTSLNYVTIPQSVNSIGYGTFSGCEKLAKIVCSNPTPLVIEKSVFQETYGDRFDFENCTLYVPEGSYEAYRTADVWKDFGAIETIDSEGSQEPKDPEPCSTPTISYTSGTLSFECSTPGAEYHYTVKDADVATDKYNTDGKVLLNGKLDILVYATADGYKVSDKATATLYWLNAEGSDDTNNINLVKTRGVMVTTDSDITISGLNDGEVVTFYSVNGVNLGGAKAVQGVLHFAKPNESIVIVKIKGNDLKIAIK